MDVYIEWFQNNSLPVVAVLLTLVLGYLYLIEKDSGVRLSKRYRNSIFEAQSKIFLSATQYLIAGNRDLAIREFLNAIDINRETIETYFALGGLFRSNGEIEKAISIHRSLIARENISEAIRLRALKELAVDFDKGGFVSKAIDTYKDVLKINRDQYEVIQSLCRIYENIEDWDQAYHYRIMLSKVGHEGQSETISHILVQKAKMFFNKGEFHQCDEDLEDALRFAPSVSAKILKLRMYLIKDELDLGHALFLELLHEHPMYAPFIFLSLKERFKASERVITDYNQRLDILRNRFLELSNRELLEVPSIILSKVRLLKERNESEEAYTLLKSWMENNSEASDVLKTEYIKLLIQLDKKDDVFKETEILLDNLHQSLTRHFCRQCGYNSDSIFWRCPQCYEWETIQFRWKV